MNNGLQLRNLQIIFCVGNTFGKKQNYMYFHMFNW